MRNQKLAGFFQATAGHLFGNTVRSHKVAWPALGLRASFLAVFVHSLPVFTLFLTIGIHSSAQADSERPAATRSSDSIVYHGKLVRPDGNPISGALTVTIRITSPEPSKCLLWAETQTVTAKNGGFAVELGYVQNRVSGAGGGIAQSFREVFINNPGLVFTSAQCEVGSSYTPSSSDDRLMTASFLDGAVTVVADTIPIKSVPFAKQAQEIGGYGLQNLVKIGGTGSSVVLSPDQVAALNSITQPGTHFDFGNKKLSNLADPAAASDAATKGWVENQISGMGSGTISSVGVSGLPLSVVNATTSPTISINVANGSQDGYLSAADWTLFNNKQPAGNYLTGITGAMVNAALGFTPIDSTSSSQVVSALGFTPLNKAGDTVGGDLAIADDKHLKLGSFASDPSTTGWGNAEKGRAWFNTTSNQVKYWDGSSIQALGVSGAGLTSLNGQSGGTQTFAEGAAGTDFDISSSGNVHTFNIPSASSSARGLLTAADWAAFNAKQPAGAYLTGITGAMVNTALGFTPQPALGFVPVSNSLPANQTYIGDGSNVATAGFFGVGQLRNSLGNAQFPASCASNQTLNWSAVTDVFSCVSISVGTTNVTDDAISFAKLQNIATNKLLGRSSGGSGDVEEISLGSGLSLSGGTLSASGSGGTVTSVGVGGLPLSVVNGTSTPTISIAQANGSQAGYLSAADWALFNNKQPAGAYLTGITGAMVNSALGFTPQPAGSYLSSISGSDVNSALGYTPVNKAGDTMTGTLNLPSNGLSVGSNQLVVSGGNIGLGTTSPGAQLEVAGQIKITGGSPGAGKVLQSDASGLASWVTLGGSESTSVSNIGTAGVGVYKQMTGTDIELKKINAGSSAITITDDTANNELDINLGTVPRASVATGTANHVLINDGTGNLSSEAVLAVSRGGTGASSITANRLIVGNGTSSVSVLAAGTSGQMLQSAGASAPAWSTATYPATTTINQLLYSSAANTVTGLATANSSVLITNGSGVPAWGAISSDTFTQYALLAGRAGGQSLRGGTSASEDLTLESTSHATKGDVIINPTSGNVGIGTTTPSVKLDVAGKIRTQATIPTLDLIETSATADNKHWHLRSTGEVFYLQALNDAGTGGGKNLQVTRSGNEMTSFALMNGASASYFKVDMSSGNVGIGTSSPGAKLEVAGQIKITGGTPGAGKVLQSDASGLASWVTLGGSESTSVSNIGTAGVGVYKQMTGTDIELKKINAGSSAITITDDTANNELDINLGTVPRASVATGTANHVLINDGTGNLSSEAVLAVSRGGTGASSITANRLIVGNGTSSVSVLAAGTSGQMLQSAGASAPAWSTATYPATTTINQLLYSSAANTVTGLATANSSVLITNGSGVPAWGAISSDTFTQYALLAGRAGGQSLRGGTSASEDLTLESTSHATKGDVIINPTSGNVGIGSTTPGYKLDVVGDVRATSFISTSDARFKTNVSTASGTKELLKIRGVNYTWKENGKRDMGVIAQEVEEVFPELVSTDPNTGYKAVRYNGFVAPMIESIREINNRCEMQEDQIRRLQRENAELKAQIQSLDERLKKIERLLENKR